MQTYEITLIYASYFVYLLINFENNTKMPN